MVDNRERGEHHIQGTVDDSHVQRQQKDDRFTEQENPRARQGKLKGFFERNPALVNVNFAVVDLAGNLGELLCAATEEHRRISLGNEQGANDPDSAGEDAQKPHNPSPASAHSQETTDDRSQDWTQERRSSKDTHRDTSLLGGKHVGDDTAGIGEGRRSKGTSEETEDNQGPGVLRASATSVERSEGAVGGGEEDLAAEELAQRGPQQRSDL